MKLNKNLNILRQQYHEHWEDFNNSSIELESESKLNNPDKLYLKYLNDQINYKRTMFIAISNEIDKRTEKKKANEYDTELQSVDLNSFDDGEY